MFYNENQHHILWIHTLYKYLLFISPWTGCLETFNGAITSSSFFFLLHILWTCFMRHKWSFTPHILWINSFSFPLTSLGSRLTFQARSFYASMVVRFAGVPSFFCPFPNSSRLSRPSWSFVQKKELAAGLDPSDVRANIVLEMHLLSLSLMQCILKKRQNIIHI